jgi:hypothetical protein
LVRSTRVTCASGTPRTSLDTLATICASAAAEGVAEGSVDNRGGGGSGGGGGGGGSGAAAAIWGGAGGGGLFCERAVAASSAKRTNFAAGAALGVDG